MRRGSISSSTARCSFSWSRTRRVALQDCWTGTVVSGRGAGMAEILRVENVSRRFGGLLALDRAAFTADDGQIVALVGPNGAGKTTLFAIITGFLQPTTG